MPFLGFIIFQILFVAVLFVVMIQIWGRQTKNATEHLTGLNEDYLKKRDEVRRLTQEAEVQSRQLLETSQKEAAAQRRTTLEEADNLKNQIVSQARKEGEIIVQEAMKARDGLLDEIHERAREMAVTEACKLLASILPETLCLQIHASFLAEAAQNEFKGITSLQVSEKLANVRIVSAYELQPEYLASLTSAVEKALGIATIPVEVSLDRSLIAGFRLHLGHMVIDSSLALKIKEAAQNAQRAA